MSLTSLDLCNIHTAMIRVIESTGGRADSVRYVADAFKTDAPQAADALQRFADRANDSQRWLPADMLTGGYVVTYAFMCCDTGIHTGTDSYGSLRDALHFAPGLAAGDGPGFATVYDRTGRPLRNF